MPVSGKRPPGPGDDVAAMVEVRLNRASDEGPARSPPLLAILRLALVGLAVTLLLVVAVSAWSVEQTRRQFEQQAAVLADAVALRHKEGEAALGGLAAMCRAITAVNRTQLALFAGEMQVRYPHIAYIAYAARVEGEVPTGFERTQRAKDRAEFRLWEPQNETRRPSSARPVHFPLVYIEPMQPSLRDLIGIDLYADPSLQPVIDRAIDQGHIAASPPRQLLNGQRGYLLIKAVSNLRPAVQGADDTRVVLIAIRANGLLPEAASLPAGESVVIRYQGEGGGELIGVHSPGPEQHWLQDLLPRLSYQRTLDGEDQPYVLQVEKRLGREVLRGDLLLGLVVIALLMVGLVYLRLRLLSERVRSRDLLHQSREQAEVTLHAIADAVITTDAKGFVNHMNTTAEQATGWSLAAARGRPLAEILSLLDEKSGGRLPDPIGQCMREGRVVRLKEALVRSGQHRNERLINATASPIRDREGCIIGAVLVFHEVSSERELQERLAYQATHDALTGLLDRGEFERQLERALQLARETGRQHALCYMDLDQFKVVNDACGHAAGDELLVQLSALLMTTVRDTDILARLGGDEFAVLLMNCPLDLAADKAMSLRDVVKTFRFIWQGKRFEVGFGVGVVPVTENSGSVTDVLRAADIACYRAKAHGRNQVFVYQSDDPELEKWRGEMRWATRIGEALENEQFRLYYQTIKPLQAEEPGLFHCELLMRREGDDGKLASPEAFIPAAERFNLMLDIDRWVVGAALPKIAQLSRQAAPRGERVLCGINLSGQSLGDQTFFAYVERLMREFEVPPEAVCFEITETVAIFDPVVAVDFIRRLRKRGSRFALDDFGTGVSSFAYLKQLPLDYVKIDGSFVRDLLHSPVDQAMVESINRVAHTLAVRTIAEYVENTALVAKLRAMGTDYAQGYAIAHPAPLDDLLSGARPGG